MKVGDRVKWALGGTELECRVFEVVKIYSERGKDLVDCRLVSGKPPDLVRQGVFHEDSMLYTFGVSQVKAVGKEPECKEQD